MADKLKIPFDQESQYHPEYDGYVKGWFFFFNTLLISLYPIKNSLNVQQFFPDWGKLSHLFALFCIAPFFYSCFFYFLSIVFTCYFFWTSHRLSSQTGGHSDVGLSTWTANVPRGPEKWPWSVRASNVREWSRHDLGKTRCMTCCTVRTKVTVFFLYRSKSRITSVYSTMLSAVLRHLLVLNIKPFSNGTRISEPMRSMTFHCKAMFAVGWLELGEADKAHHLLEKCFRNIQGPFQVSFWLTRPLQHELLTWMLFECLITSPHRCGVNYQIALVLSTFSQEWGDSCRLCCLVILGSGQLSMNMRLQYKQSSSSSDPEFHISFFISSRVQKECLAFSPLLPIDVTELCIRGVNYLGCQMDWLLRKDDVCVILREQANTAGNAKSCDLQVVLKASGMKIPLTPGNTQRHARKATHFCFIQTRFIYFVQRRILQICIWWLWCQNTVLFICLYTSLFSGQPVTFPREPGYVCKLALASSCWPFWNNHDPSNHMLSNVLQP